MPNKHFCLSKLAPFRIPCLQPSGQAMVDLKLWFQSDLLKVTKVWLLTVALFGLAFLPYALVFVTIHTTKLGMKDFKAQQWRVERYSNLKPPNKYRCSNHYIMLPLYIILPSTSCSPQYILHAFIFHFTILNLLAWMIRSWEMRLKLFELLKLGCRFDQIIHRYINVIVGWFNGHTHKDELRLFYDPSLSETSPVPVLTGYVAPSVTTYSDTNMAYRWDLGGGVEIKKTKDRNFEKLEFLKTLLIVARVDPPWIS